MIPQMQDVGIPGVVKPRGPGFGSKAGLGKPSCFKDAKYFIN